MSASFGPGSIGGAGLSVGLPRSREHILDEVFGLVLKGAVVAVSHAIDIKAEGLRNGC